MNIKDIDKTALTLEQCEALPTKRLLAYYRSRRWMRRLGYCEICGDQYDYCPAYTGAKKQEVDLALAYLNSIKAMLDKREHVQ